MNNFKFIETGFEGLWVIEPQVFGDERGFFMETYNKEEFSKKGIPTEFVQDNHSRSQKGVLRALHFQKKYPQGKLVRVGQGKVWDVAVDLRKNSKTYGKWHGVELSAENKKMYYISPGFAHGFVALEDNTDFLYKCTELYYPEDEAGIIWNDPDLAIKWPVDFEPILSDKDKAFFKFKEVNFAY